MERLTISKLKSKQVWEKERVWECLTTEEKVVWTGFGSIIITRHHGGIKSVNVKEDVVLGRIEPEADPVLCVAGGRDCNDELVTFSGHKSGLIRRWTGFTFDEPHSGINTMKTDHRGPMLRLLGLRNFRYLISIGSDLLLKVWDADKRHCVGVLRGLTSIPSAVAKQEVDDVASVACGLVDGSIKVWSLHKDPQSGGSLCTTPTAASLSKHTSQISCLTFLGNSKTIVACGRDQLMSVWSLEDGWKCIKLLPTFEEVEQIVNVSTRLANKLSSSSASAENGSYCVMGGEKGKVRMWNITATTNPVEVNLSGAINEASATRITDLNDEEEEELVVVKEDVIVRTNGVENVVTTMNNNEVVGFALVGDTRLVIATNTPTLRIFDFASGKTTLTDGRSGHTDSVLAVAASKQTTHHFVSSGKDEAVCLWKIGEEDGQPELLAKGVGHTSHVAAVAIASANSVFSASKNGIVKAWSLQQQQDDDEEEEELRTRRTVQAHDREVNSLDVSFDREMLVSGSQDKTVRLWRVADLALLGTLSGHRRGIWCCKFFRNGDRNRIMIATASADANVKLWDKNSANQFSCVHTLEGHLASVLCVVPLAGGKSLASVSTDGLLKVWSAENNFATDVGSFDAHEDKIWAVECVGGEKIVTGSADGQVAVWRNVTEKARAEELSKSERLVKTDQKLSNYLANGELEKALRVSLQLDRPRLAKSTLSRLQSKGELESALRGLGDDQKNKLLPMVVKWNAYGNHCEVAQNILKVLLMDAVASGKTVSASQCEGLVAYSDKHHERLNRLHSRIAVADLLLDNIM